MITPRQIETPPAVGRMTASSNSRLPSSGLRAAGQCRLGQAATEHQAEGHGENDVEVHEQRMIPDLARRLCMGRGHSDECARTWVTHFKMVSTVLPTGSTGSGIARNILPVDLSTTPRVEDF